MLSDIEKPVVSELSLPINIYEIMKQIPHRYPFLLIDRVTHFDANLAQIKARKNVTFNEPYFQGHFPELPVMPGVLIVEAMAQASGILSVLMLGARKENELYFFAAIDNVKFKRQVIPGDTLDIGVTLVKTIRGVGKYVAQAFVEETLVAQAELMIAKKEV